MGFEKREPTVAEMEKMKFILEEELSNGIHGLSLGLDNYPGSLATMEELIDMAKIVKKYNGICSIHMREEGYHLIQSINEVLEIGEKSGVKLQISHLKAAHPQNWGKVKDSISIISKAKQGGMDVDYDVYPYTYYESVLSDVLPTWIRQFSPERIANLLKEEDIRKNVINDMLDMDSSWGTIKDFLI
ncbi:MAG: N-acyl-D-amino-acid deacylase [Clostridium sp.]|jgi:N-acyl-D-amino-acid deacylase